MLWLTGTVGAAAKSCPAGSAGTSAEASIYVWPPGKECAALGGGERTVEEYRSLLAAAGFSLTRAAPTPHGESVIEAAPV